MIAFPGSLLDVEGLWWTEGGLVKEYSMKALKTDGWRKGKGDQIGYISDFYACSKMLFLCICPLI